VRRVLARLAWFPPAAEIEPCMRFSRTRLPDVLHRGHSASRSPQPVGSWRDDGPVEVDQPEPVRRLVGDCLPAVSPAAPVALGDEPRNAVQRVVVDLVELAAGVPIAEVARPAAQEAVDVLHDIVNSYQQPAPVGDLPDPVAGLLGGLP
jgi:hypothetical protein